MPVLALHILKISFIALLYLFLWVVGRNITGHLRSESARSEAPAVAVGVVTRPSPSPAAQLNAEAPIIATRAIRNIADFMLPTSSKPAL